MPDIKNYDKTEIDNDLKQADAEKSGGINAQLAGINISRPRKSEGDFKGRQTARKKLPLAVDIIVSILIVLLFAGTVEGAYYAFRFFANDYENANVEYVIVVDASDAAAYESLVNTNLYFDTNNSLEHFGKVKSVEFSETYGKVLITVGNTVRYKENEGYSVGEIKLAVGKDYILRSENGVKISGTVVELTDNERPLKVQSARIPAILNKNEEGEI
jgi:hypothetical protein